MDAVDGNAIGGLLIDVFGTEMTAASSICATCGAQQAGSRARRLPTGPRHHRPLPDLRQRPHGVGQAHGRDQCRPLRTGQLEPTGIGLIPAGGIQDRPACRTSTQISNQRRDKEGMNMPHEESMSMSDEPQEESMSMSDEPPDQESMSMGQPDQESMSMGQPDQESM